MRFDRRLALAALAAVCAVAVLVASLVSFHLDYMEFLSYDDSGFHQYGSQFTVTGGR